MAFCGMSLRAMRSMAVLACVLAASSAASTAALAQGGSGANAATPAPASAAVVINLIRLLVQEGVLTQAKADALIREAQDEAAMAQRNRPPAVAAAPKAAPGAPAMAEATRDMGTLPPTPAAGGQAAPPGTVRVIYVPEVVKKQIADEAAAQVEQKAKDEGWAAQHLPEWTQRFHLYGDFRLRQEWDLFDPRNANTFVNYEAINSGSPFDTSVINGGTGLPPALDTTANRERLRLRARLGLNADVTDGVDAGIRLATGNTTNPVSTNTTLGTDLNKDSFLLDLAFLHYQPTPWLGFWAGRFANPWFGTDLVWGPDLAFDGIAGHIEKPVTDTVTPFLTAGAFPIENTDFNFPDNNSGSNKEPSADKWLYAAQAGLGWKAGKDLDAKFGLALYAYTNIQGVQSSPCDALNSSIPCNTDDTRPGFIQQGNTLFAIRDTTPVAVAELSSTNNPNNFQYFGLASPFRELDFTTRFDYKHYDPIHVIFDGDFVTNLAFNSRDIASRNPVNNQGPSPGPDPVTGQAVAGPWAGGANGFLARVTVGHPQINELWDWNASAAYKYLESDAVLDAFTDPDFHLGGTNAKGYILGGNLGVAHNVWLTGRWLSASEISGAPYSVNVVQVDLNARF